jgi:hypothetical protein
MSGAVGQVANLPHDMACLRLNKPRKVVAPAFFFFWHAIRLQEQPVGRPEGESGVGPGEKGL